LIDLNIVD
jgi:hypothetical protein